MGRKCLVLVRRKWKYRLGGIGRVRIDALFAGVPPSPPSAVHSHAFSVRVGEDPRLPVRLVEVHPMRRVPAREHAL